MRTFVLIGLTLASLTGFAQDDSYAYAGLGIGVFGHSVKIPNQGFSFTISDRTTASKLYGGWRVSEHLSIEGSYGQSGELNWRDSIIVGNADGIFGPDPRVTLDASTRAEWTTTTVSVLGHVNHIFGGIGRYALDGSFTFDAECSCGPGDFDVANDTSATDFFFTVGAEWRFERWAIRGQYELYDTQGTSQDVVYIASSFVF